MTVSKLRARLGSSTSSARIGCPSPEELAAFIDGQLQGAERERIVEHLASCEDCYAVFTGVVDFNEQENPTAEMADDEEDEDPPAEVVPFPVKRPRRWQVPLKLAACLVAGVGGALLLYRYLTIPVEITTAELVATYEGQAAEFEGKTWFEESVTRGAEGYDGASEFLLGVYWTELRVVVLAGDHETGPEIARKILNLITETRVDGKVQAPAIPGLDPEVIELVRELTESAGASDENELPKLDLVPERAHSAGTPFPPDLLTRLDRAEEHIDSYAKELGLYEISFGKWVAASRFAAIAEDPTFFTGSSKNRRYLAWLLRQREELFLPDEVVESLEQVRTAIWPDGAEHLNYEDLVSTFNGIINYYAEDADRFS